MPPTTPRRDGTPSSPRRQQLGSYVVDQQQPAGRRSSSARPSLAAQDDDPASATSDEDGVGSPSKRTSSKRPTLRSTPTVQNSGPVSPVVQAFAHMKLPSLSTFGLTDYFSPLPSPSASVTTPGSRDGSRGRSASTASARSTPVSPAAQSDRGASSSFFSSRYSPMTLASLSMPTRPLSPPPTYPNFQARDGTGAASSDDGSPSKRAASSSRRRRHRHRRSSTVDTASSSGFVSAASRASSSGSDESDTADDDALESSAARRSRAADVRRESETSEDTLGTGSSPPHATAAALNGLKMSPATEGNGRQAALEKLTNGRPSEPAAAQRSQESSSRGAVESSNSSSTIDGGSKWGAAKRKTSLFQRVFKNLQPSPTSSRPPSPANPSPVRESSETPPTSSFARPPKRTSSFASSFLTSPSRAAHAPQRKFVKVHAKGLNSKHKHIGRIFLAQTLNTAAAVGDAGAEPVLRPILTGVPLMEEPSPISSVDGAAAFASPTASRSQPPPSASRRSSLSRGNSRSTSPAPPSPTPASSADKPAVRPSISIRVDVPSSRSSSLNSPSRRASISKKEKVKGQALWCLEWSYDGRYLATAGQDSFIRLYQVRSADDLPPPSAGGSGGSSSLFESTSVLEDEPVQTWRGHTDGILTLAWSKNGFLASGSMDKTARLWHPTRANCLTIFQHPDFVSSIAFHPKDDRFFLTGCCDFKLRVWSILEKKVRCAADLPEMVTAVAFSVDGKTCAAGTFSGRVHFFSDNLKEKTQLKVRSTRGKNAKGKKITHLQFVSSSTSAADERLLVTSNDSRVRLYRLVDFSVDLKLRGHQNDSSQISATFGDDGRWIVCGSEDGSCFLWSPDWPRDGNEGGRALHFQADDSLVACAALAPLSTRLLLAAAGDPIYKVPRRSLVGPSRPGSPMSSNGGGHHHHALSPVLSNQSFGLLSPTSELSLDLARSLSRGTLGGAELEALLDTPLIAVATMRGVVKIFRGDPGSAPASQPPPVSRSPPSTESTSSSANSTRRGSLGSLRLFRRPSQSSSVRPPAAPCQP